MLRLFGILKKSASSDGIASNRLFLLEISEMIVRRSSSIPNICTASRIDVTRALTVGIDGSAIVRTKNLRNLSRYSKRLIDHEKEHLNSDDPAIQHGFDFAN
jgi:hypothetical protein